MASWHTAHLLSRSWIQELIDNLNTAATSKHVIKLLVIQFCHVIVYLTMRPKKSEECRSRDKGRVQLTMNWVRSACAGECDPTSITSKWTSDPFCLAHCYLGVKNKGIMLGPFLNLCNGPGFTNGTGKFVLRLSRTTISRFSFANGTWTLADISRHGHGLHLLHLSVLGGKRLRIIAILVTLDMLEIDLRHFLEVSQSWWLLTCWRLTSSIFWGVPGYRLA